MCYCHTAGNTRAHVSWLQSLPDDSGTQHHQPHSHAPRLTSPHLHLCLHVLCRYYDMSLTHVQVTGQEILKVPGSAHISCTVEMAAISSHADVAVIDEIQVRYN